MFKGSYAFVYTLIAVLLIGLIFGGSESDQNGYTQVLPPDVVSSLNELVEVEILTTLDSDEIKVSLVNESGEWRVAERYGYPANQTKLVRLLRDLADARLLEEKTKKPENFAALGVGESATRLRLSGDLTLAFGQQASGRSGRYMRYESGGDDANQVYLQSAVLSELSADPAVWLAPDILDIAPAQVARIEIQHPDDLLTLTRGEDGQVSVAGISDSQLRYAGIADPIFNMLSGLKLQDIAPRDSVDVAGSVTVQVSLVDSSFITIDLAKQQDRFWLTVDSDSSQVPESVHNWAFAVSRLTYDNMTKTTASLKKANTDEL